MTLRQLAKDTSSAHQLHTHTHGFARVCVQVCGGCAVDDGRLKFESAILKICVGPDQDGENGLNWVDPKMLKICFFSCTLKMLMNKSTLYQDICYQPIYFLFE